MPEDVQTDLLQVRHLRGVRAGLEKLSKNLSSRLEQVAVVTDEFYSQEVLENVPVAGQNRYIVPRAGFGGLVALNSGAITLVLPPQLGRLGGTIVNYGASPVVLYLSGTGSVTNGIAVPALYLNGSGGSWDLKLSSVLWAGPVTAVAQGGASNLSVAVV